MVWSGLRHVGYERSNSAARTHNDVNPHSFYSSMRPTFRAATMVGWHIVSKTRSGCGTCWRRCVSCWDTRYEDLLFHRLIQIIWSSFTYFHNIIAILITILPLWYETQLSMVERQNGRRMKGHITRIASVMETVEKFAKFRSKFLEMCAPLGVDPLKMTTC